MTLLFFAFIGWEMIGHLAEEFKNPLCDIPLSLGVAVLLVNALYFSVAFATVGTEVYLAGNPITAIVALVAFRWGDMAGSLVAFLGLSFAIAPFILTSQVFPAWSMRKRATAIFPNISADCIQIIKHHTWHWYFSHRFTYSFFS